MEERLAELGVALHDRIYHEEFIGKLPTGTGPQHPSDEDGKIYRLRDRLGPAWGVTDLPMHNETPTKGVYVPTFLRESEEFNNCQVQYTSWLVPVHDEEYIPTVEPVIDELVENGNMLEFIQIFSTKRGGGEELFNVLARLSTKGNFVVYSSNSGMESRSWPLSEITYRDIKNLNLDREIPRHFQDVPLMQVFDKYRLTKSLNVDSTPEEVCQVVIDFISDRG